MKVTKTEIVTCQWNPEFYAVKIDRIVLAELNYSASEVNTKKLKKVSNPEASELIYMNYTWGYDSETKKASPFFNIVPYNTYGDDAAPCKKQFTFPSPKALKKVSTDTGYEEWYSNL
jgi:hypothetical protein